MWLKPYMLQAVRHHPSLRCPSLTAASKVASPSTTFGAHQRLETSVPRSKPQESMTSSQNCTDGIKGGLTKHYIWRTPVAESFSTTSGFRDELTELYCSNQC